MTEQERTDRDRSRLWDEVVEPFLVGFARSALSVAFCWLVWLDLQNEASIPTTVYLLLFGIVIGVRPGDLKALNEMRKKL